MYFYYPLSSKDFSFENIFSSESISPPFFYQNRNFGIGYFNVIPNINNYHALILFSKPPKFEVENGMKFILQIDENSINTNDLIYLDEGIFAYEKTIYLNKSNFYMNFFSEKERRVAMLKSASSLPTKNIEKYVNNFKIINEKECEDYSLDKISIRPNHSSNLILKDRQYNQFKGFVYGIACGLYGSKSKEELFFKKLIREVFNTYAELKNRTSNSYTKSSYNARNNSENLLYTNRLLEILKLTEQAYLDFFGEPIFTDDDLIEIVFKSSDHLNSIEEAKLFLKHIVVEDDLFETNRYTALKNKYSKSHRKDNSPLDLLKSQIGLFIDNAVYNNKSKIDINDLNNNIKISLYQIEKSFSKNLQNKNVDAEFYLNDLVYDLQKNQIIIPNNFQGLISKEVEEMTFIANAILKYPNDRKMPIRNAVLQIVESVGSTFSKEGKETFLYQYLNDQVDTYKFEKISSSVMKNFVAFVFNIESIEKLENFLDKKDVQSQWIAYSFWGLFNGFANLSGNFTNLIFSKTGEPIQVYLDKFLDKFVQDLKKAPSKDENLNVIEEDRDVYMTANEDLFERFYQKFVNGNYTLSKEELRSLIPIKDKGEFYNTGKKKFNLNKKNSEKLFNCIKREFNSPILFN